MISLQDIPVHVFRPTEHLLAHLVNQVRPDGRSLHQPRPIAVIPTTWHQEGTTESTHRRNMVASKQVQIGGSIALGVVTLSIGTPSLQKPNMGDIECKVALNHLLPTSMWNQRRNDEVYTSSGNAGNLPGELTPSTQEVEYMLNTVFNTGKIIDLTQLCIEPENAVIRLSVHITVLSYAGNLRDLCFLLAMLALRDVQLPTTIPRPSDLQLKQLAKSDANTFQFWQSTSARYAVNYDSPRPLHILRTVMPVTLAYLTDQQSSLSVRELLNNQNSNKSNSSSNEKQKYYWYLDPTADEEAIAEGSITVIVDPQSTRIMYSALNAQGLSSSALQQVMSLATDHAQKMATALQL